MDVNNTIRNLKIAAVYHQDDSGVRQLILLIIIIIIIIITIIIIIIKLKLNLWLTAPKVTTQRQLTGRCQYEGIM